MLLSLQLIPGKDGKLQIWSSLVIFSITIRKSACEFFIQDGLLTKWQYVLLNWFRNNWFYLQWFPSLSPSPCSHCCCSEEDAVHPTLQIIVFCSFFLTSLSVDVDATDVSAKVGKRKLLQKTTQMNTWCNREVKQVFSVLFTSVNFGEFDTCQCMDLTCWSYLSEMLMMKPVLRVPDFDNLFTWKC